MRSSIKYKDKLMDIKWLDFFVHTNNDSIMINTSAISIYNIHKFKELDLKRMATL